MTGSPSHSSLVAKVALGVKLPAQVLSSISVTAHGAEQRQPEAWDTGQQPEGNTASACWNGSRSSQCLETHYAAKGAAMECSAHLLQTVHCLQTQAGDEQSALWQLYQPNTRLSGTQPHLYGDWCVIVTHATVVL